MELRPIQLGNRSQIATGWLVIANGAVRAFLAPADDRGGLNLYACDDRLRGPDGYMYFSGLGQVRRYFRRQRL